jgi:hypothetical protein
MCDHIYLMGSFKLNLIWIFVKFFFWFFFSSNFLFVDSSIDWDLEYLFGPEVRGRPPLRDAQSMCNLNMHII